jgi:hypothetical protein
MNRILQSVYLFSAALCAATASAALTTFSYTQTDTATGAGMIAPFSYDDGGGPILFAATSMPPASVLNPNPGLTPAGSVGAQTVQSGNSNEANTSVGLLWSDSVQAIGFRGASMFTIDIPLRFVNKVTQTPDSNDYNWNVAFGDNPGAGVDAVTGSNRFAMWLSRDEVVDAVETPNTFQRYTQQNHTFAAGLNTFSNTDTTTTAIKDATDPPGNPQGIDAATRDLAFYFGWRDQGSLTSGAILIDTFTVGGLLDADINTLQLVPEPSSCMLAGMALAAAGFTGWRRRRK